MKLYKIFLPKYYNDGKKIEDKKMRKVTTDIMERFGGYTVNPFAVLPIIDGAWKDKKTHETYLDKLICIEIFMEDTFDNQKWLISFKELVRQQLKQEELFVIVQNAEIIKG